MQEFNPILGPAAVLAAWSVVMFFIYVTRVMGSGAKLGELPPGFRGPDGEADAPEKMKWTRHNNERVEGRWLLHKMLVIVACPLHFFGGIGLAVRTSKARRQFAKFCT